MRRSSIGAVLCLSLAMVLLGFAGRVEAFPGTLLGDSFINRGFEGGRVFDADFVASLDLTENQKAGLWDLMIESRTNRQENEGSRGLRRIISKILSGDGVEDGTRQILREGIEANVFERVRRAHEALSLLAPGQREKIQDRIEKTGESRHEEFRKAGEFRRKGDSVGGAFPPVFRRLDLSDDQKGRIREIYSENRKMRRAYAERGDLEWRGMGELFWKAEADETTLREATAKIADSIVETLFVHGEIRRQVRAVLTGEQLEELETPHKGRPFFRAP